MKLHNWQKKALIELLIKQKIILEVATGSGKTFFVADFLNKIKKKDYRVLIVSPKIVIMDNWNKELKKYFPFTDIGYFYSDIKEYSKITLTTTSSIKNINLDVFDILIVDEIHNSFTPRWKNIYDREWKYLIGLSATVRADNSKYWNYFKYFDYNIFSYSLKEAIDDEVLSKFSLYNYYVLMDNITREKYDIITDKITNIIRIAGDYYTALNNPRYKLTLLKYMNERKKLIYGYNKKFNVLNKIIKKHINNKIIIFNESNDIAMKIYLDLLDLDVSCRVANSNYSRQEINDVINDFEKDKFNVLITTKMFDEGYNLPKLDVAIIFSGESTKRQFSQRLGRVLRKKEDNNAIIYQIYVKDTMEEDYIEHRNKDIKQIASKIITEEVKC